MIDELPRGQHAKARHRGLAGLARCTWRHPRSDRAPAPSPARSRKDLLEIVWARAAIRETIVEARGMRQVTDVGAIERAVDAISQRNPDKAEQAKAKPGALRAGLSVK